MTSRSNSDRQQPSATRRQVLGTSAAGIAALAMPAIARGAVPGVPVAVVVGLTGATAAWGGPVSDAARMVVAEINANGGIRSKGNATLDLIVADHQSKPEMAATLMQRVISLQKVVCVIGNSYSGASMVGSKVAEAARTPMLSLDTADSLSQRGLQYFYRIGPRTGILAAAAVDFSAGAVKMFDTPPRKVAIMADDTTFSQDSVKGLLANLPRTGWNVVDNISYPGGGVADFASMIQRLKVMGVDLVFQSTFAPDGIQIVRAMKAVDFNPMAAVHVSGAPYTPDFRSALKADANFVICSVGFVPELVKSNPSLSAFNAAHQQRFNRPLDDQASQCVLAFGTLLDALERATDISPEALQQALKKTDLPLGANRYINRDGVKFDEKGDNVRASALVMQLRDGAQRIVGPKAVATTEVIWPMPKWSERKA